MPRKYILHLLPVRPGGLLQKQYGGETESKGAGWRCKVKTYLRSVVYQDGNQPLGLYVVKINFAG